MILVTGATGLVGTHLLIELSKQGKQGIRALYRSEKSKERCQVVFVRLFPCIKNPTEAQKAFDQVEWCKGNINDIPALQRAFQDVDFVYHCAALISFNTSDFNQMRKVNIEGTANVVNCCLEKKVKKLCHVSSIASLGEPDQNGSYSETSEWNPESKNSVYAISKYGAELEVWRGIQEGLPAVLINPGVIIGCGYYQSGSGLLFSKIHKGLNYYTAGSSGFVSVKDVVESMVRLSESSIQNERYVLVAENLTYQDVVTKIAMSFGLKPPTKKATNLMLQLLARLQWISNRLIGFPKNVLSSVQIKSLQSSSVYNNQKIKTTLHFSFEDISKSIADTSADFRIFY